MNDCTRGRATFGSGSFSNISPTISSPRPRYSLYNSVRNGASSWQLGHQLPPIARMITLPRNWGSVSDTIFQVRSGKAKRNGAVGYLTLVYSDGNGGSGMPFARLSRQRLTREYT